ncbi:MAG: hypothetical protein P8189_19750 [Anaerolineae bacterium]
MVDRSSSRAQNGISIAQAPSGGKRDTGNAQPRPSITIHSVADAILHTLVYADLFDYPLTVLEIHRFLTGYAAPLATVEEHLGHHDLLCERLGSTAPFWFLAGREHLVAMRQEREVFSRTLWRQARRYARLMTAIPFVRMVSITGSLAMNNASHAQDDVDLLIVAAKGRVWLARGMVILVVRLAQQMGTELCPNYVLSEHRLHLDEPSLFTAHELAQLVPLHGLETYHRLLEDNAWLVEYLPNALPREVSMGGTRWPGRGWQWLLETVLAGRAGDAVERWERERKIPRLIQAAERRGGTEVTYTPDLCKGHVDDHASLVHELYMERLAKYRQGTSVEP